MLANRDTSWIIYGTAANVFKIVNLRNYCFNSKKKSTNKTKSIYKTIQMSLQVLNLVQSYVTLRVPLYVSYVFHSPVGTGGWQHFDLQSELRLTFVYDTAILWKDGIGSPPQADLQGESVTRTLWLITVHTEGTLYFNQEKCSEKCNEKCFL